MLGKGRSTNISLSFPEADSYEDASTNAILPHPMRRTAKIVRRRDPTVAVVTKQLQSTPQSSSSSGGYSTEEREPVQTLQVYYDEEQDTKSLLCGWRNDEGLNQRELLLNMITDRPLLQSRELSSRLYSSRLNSRLSRKREQYSFQHFDSEEDHMQYYRNTSSFSSLILASKKSPTVQELPEQHDSLHETAGMTSQRQRKPIYTRGPAGTRATRNTDHNSTSKTPFHLHSLASRLGVVESIQEPRLLQSPRPASIAKKRGSEIIEELLVCTQRSDSKAETRELTAAKNQKPPSRQYTRRFPSLTEPLKRKSTSTSTISITKYLNVGLDKNNNNKKTTKTLDKSNQEQKPTAQTDNDDLQSISSDASYLIEERVEEDRGEESPSWPLYTTNSFDTCSQYVKDEVIQRKANSLGLLSHKWAKTFIERGFMSGNIPRKIYYDLSRPSTRGDSTDTSSRGERRNATSQGVTIQRPKSNRERHTDLITEKLQKLESVYKNKTEQRQVSGRSCENRRIVTGKGERGHYKPPLTHSLSHPANKEICPLRRTSSKGERGHYKTPLTHSLSHPANKEICPLRRTLSKGERGVESWHVRGKKWTTRTIVA